MVANDANAGAYCGALTAIKDLDHARLDRNPEQERQIS